MKKMIIKSAALTLLLTLGIVSALANGKNLKDSISLSKPAQVNDVKLKPGTYQIKFNAETNEVTISNGDRTMATVKVSVQTSEKKSSETQAYISDTGNGAVLAKVVFKGDDRAIIFQEATTAGK
jgi:hypothetical protein